MSLIGVNISGRTIFSAMRPVSKKRARPWLMATPGKPGLRDPLPEPLTNFTHQAVNRANKAAIP
jgi:hypothetical protein